MVVGFFYASSLVSRNLLRYARIALVCACKEAKEKKRPDADMDHDIGSIEYVVPVGDMLNVDKVDHATIHKSIQDVAGPSADDEAEANILIALDRRTDPEIGAYAYQKCDANRGKHPAHSLQHAKHTAMITDMSEVNHATPL